ncbi:MAG: ribosome biogenesis GTPase YlqF [Myxococcota bacterium]
MTIEWFPGHMLTARRQAAEALRNNDVVIEVLDARVPYSSCNPLVETLRREAQRPALKILNKSDLADPIRTQQWLQFYNHQPGVRALAISCKKPHDAKRIPDEARKLAPGRASASKPLRMMILGIPNVGKSTLMNALLQRHVAKVGDEPAITKKPQVHELGKFMWLTDTAGMLWPAIEQVAALKLAITHSIGRNAYEETVAASDLAAYLLANYRELLQKRFGELPPAVDAHGVFSVIARKRGLIVKGGAPDLEKSALVLLHEFRNGTLGRISLEAPAEVAERAPLVRR